MLDARHGTHAKKVRHTQREQDFVDRQPRQADVTVPPSSGDMSCNRNILEQNYSRMQKTTGRATCIHINEPLTRNHPSTSRRPGDVPAPATRAETASRSIDQPATTSTCVIPNNRRLARSGSAPNPGRRSLPMPQSRIADNPSVAGPRSKSTQLTARSSAVRVAVIRSHQPGFHSSPRCHRMCTTIDPDANGVRTGR